MRVTRDGRQHVAEDYGYLEPLELFGMESAIWGMAPEAWDWTEKKPESACDAFFRRTSDTLLSGLTFTAQLPAGTTIDDRSRSAEHYVIRDDVGELLLIDSAFSKLEPTTLSDVPLTEVTLNGARAMQHERRANKVATREVIMKGVVFSGTASVPEAARYTRARYQNLSDARAQVADEIIETLQPFDWR